MSGAIRSSSEGDGVSALIARTRRGLDVIAEAIAQVSSQRVPDRRWHTSPGPAPADRPVGDYLLARLAGFVARAVAVPPRYHGVRAGAHRSRPGHGIRCACCQGTYRRVRADSRGRPYEHRQPCARRRSTGRFFTLAAQVDENRAAVPLGGRPRAAADAPRTTACSRSCSSSSASARSSGTSGSPRHPSRQPRSPAANATTCSGSTRPSASS